MKKKATRDAQVVILRLLYLVPIDIPHFCLVVYTESGSLWLNFVLEASLARLVLEYNLSIHVM